MKPVEIQELIKFVAKSGVSEVEIENKDFKITIKTPPYKKGKITDSPTIVQVAPSSISETLTQPQFVAQPVDNTTKVNVEPAKSAKKEEKEEEDNYIPIKSPMIGTFYRKASPDKPNFVNVGDDIANDSVVCIIEAMKLFNEIEAEMTGKIVKILVDDGSPVEYDQPLFLLDPS